MREALTGGAGLVLLLAASVLAVVLDVPGGPAGWRNGGPRRWALLGLAAGVTGLAVAATLLRLRL